MLGCSAGRDTWESPQSNITNYPFQKMAIESIGVLTGVIAIGGLMLGMEISSVGCFLGTKLFQDYFGDISSVLQGVLTGGYPLGGLLGAFIGGAGSERYGVVRVLAAACLLWLLGSVMSVSAVCLPMLIIGRVLKGLSVGSLSSQLPIYVSIVFPHRLRARLLSILQLCLTVGIFLMILICYGFVELFPGQRAFRFSWGVEIIPGVVLLICTPYLPTSQISLSPVDISDSSECEAPATLSEKKISSQINEKEKFKYKYLFYQPMLKFTVVGLLTQVICQLSGINVLMYYFFVICQMVGIGRDAKFISALIQCTVNVVFTMVPFIYIEKIGRKVILLIGSSLLSVCLAFISFLMFKYGGDILIDGSLQYQVPGVPGIIVLVLCILFVAVFASTLGCVSWIYVNELFPSHARAKGNALCGSLSWVLNLILALTTPLLFEQFKWITFLMLFTFSFIGVGVIFFQFPETKDRQELEGVNSSQS